MPSVLVRTDLSRKDLRLLLSNDEGYAQDAFDVRWTIFDLFGRQISGWDLLAIKRSTGQYYAPFHTDVKNGNYTIRWSIKEQSNWPPKVVEQKFFVVDPSSYECCGNAVCPDGVPLPRGLAYLCGTRLGPGDLPIHLRDDRGVLTDALGVFWTIQNECGRSISPRRAAARKSTGSYYAPWHVDANSGDYAVLWEFMRDADSPLQSTRLPFSVINPVHPILTPFDIPCEKRGCDSCGSCGSCDRCRPCDSPCGPSRIFEDSSCHEKIPNFPCLPISAPIPSECGHLKQRCQSEVPRMIHLATGMLPGNGAFTDQPQFRIPCGIRNLTFYITYTRTTPGGYAIFKLMWGNGVEESQETVVSLDISGPTNMGLQGMYLQELVGPTPIDNNPITFIFYVSVPGGAKTARLLAAENGSQNSPGTIGITLTGSS